MLFNKIKERILTLEVVIDALISLLEKKETLRRDEIQIEILSKAQDKEDEDA